MLKTRIITALILISLVVFTTFYLEPVWFLFISSLFILVGIWEWFNLFSLDGLDRVEEFLKYLVIFPVFFIFLILQPILYFLDVQLLAPFFDPPRTYYFVIYVSLLFFWLVIAPLMIINYQKGLFHHPNPLRTWLWTGKWPWNSLTIGPKATVQSFLLGNVLLWGMWISLVMLLFHSPYILLLLLLIIWSADTAAYFSGKKYGKHILADNVSPGKTWEGVIGGLITGILATFLALHFFREFLSVDLFQASPIKIILLSSVTVIYSIVGDLFISLIKRQTGKKDSGILFPGHGGVLDRIDSLMSGSVAFIFWGIFLGLFDFGLI